MKKKIAFVLGGGGSRGALQVGALRALLEADIHPDLVVGTSAGAANASHLAYYGMNKSSIETLMSSWHDVAKADLLPSNYIWLTIRILFNRAGIYPVHRMKNFFVTHGVNPDLRFGDLKIPLILVSADLNSGSTILFGTNPQQFVLDGLLASTALPPWIHPLEKDGRFLIDGGLVSNLPIEPALRQNADEIIALDLSDPRELPADTQGFGIFFEKLINTIEQRQLTLEIALAKAKGAVIHHILLSGKCPIPVWDFQHTEELFEIGYQTTKDEIIKWQSEKNQTKDNWLLNIFKKKRTNDSQ